MRTFTGRKPAFFAVVLAAGVALAACGADAAPAPTATTGSLAGICPATIPIQIDWYATPERAAAFQLAGPDGTIDAKKGTYTGKLGATGVSIEVRLGGPFIGFTPIPQQMYQDKSIYLGYVATDDAVGAAAKFPTRAVVAPLDINPQVLMWDPATYTVNAWTDVAATKAKVIYIEGMPFMDYLVSKGYVTKDMLDASFDGTPARFVADRGKVIQQGYASNEPYRWEHDVAEWKKPVKSLLIHDSGYTIYPQGLAVRSDEFAANSACLKKLVPMIQQAQVDYMKDPTATNATLVKIGQTIQGGPPITADGNANAVTVMKDLKLVGNGPDATLGNFDDARVDATIALLRPIFAARGVTVPDGLKAADLVTNEFIDPSITLP
ncbi:nitrate ABC transporter substrate-binding protein [Luedemannella flava]|uniref:Nitrate ABC transporter substrate-binding protein n=1 Tax=Luedemannella flava TaxID=349316 RepID=A0ABN2M2L0_9ACTN